MAFVQPRTKHTNGIKEKLKGVYITRYGGDKSNPILKLGGDVLMKTGWTHNSKVTPMIGTGTDAGFLAVGKTSGKNTHNIKAATKTSQVGIISVASCFDNFPKSTNVPCNYQINDNGQLVISVPREYRQYIREPKAIA